MEGGTQECKRYEEESPSCGLLSDGMSNASKGLWELFVVGLVQHRNSHFLILFWLFIVMFLYLHIIWWHYIHFLNRVFNISPKHECLFRLARGTASSCTHTNVILSTEWAFRGYNGDGMSQTQKEGCANLCEHIGHRWVVDCKRILLWLLIPEKGSKRKQLWWEKVTFSLQWQSARTWSLYNTTETRGKDGGPLTFS